MKLPNPALAVRRASFPLRAPTTPGSVTPLEREPRTGADYDTAWARRFAARFARLAIHEIVVAPMVRAVASPTVTGTDRLADLGHRPVIFAANHHSHIDTPLLLRTIPEPWRHRTFVGAAADYFFDTWMKGALSALTLNAIPIERTKVNRRSALAAAELIEDGWSMVIFPEGGRSPDGWGQEFRGGAAYLAQRCDVAIVPVHIEGTGRILAKGDRVPTPGSTTITFGSPIHGSEDENSPRLAARIEDAVASLADEVTTDWWQARRRAHAKESPALVGPEVGAWRRAWDLSVKNAKIRRKKRTWP